MQPSDFTVIIVNYNGETVLARALRSCSVEGIALSQCIVVDNGSRDGSLALLARGFPEVNLVANSCNAGFSRAVNQGLARAKSDFILLLNNDAEILPGAFDALRKCFTEHPQAAMISPRLLDPEGNAQNVVAPWPRWWQEALPKSLAKRLVPGFFGGRLRGVEHPQAVPSVIGAALALRHRAIDILGPMDESFFFYLEETEWCERAWRNDWEVWFCPSAHVLHRLGATANRFQVEARIEFQRSRLRYARKMEGTGAAIFLEIFLPLRAAIDAVAHGLLLLLSLGRSQQSRRRFMIYKQILAWHLQGRPEAAGLPDKCPPRS